MLLKQGMGDGAWGMGHGRGTGHGAWEVGNGKMGNRRWEIGDSDKKSEIKFFQRLLSHFFGNVLHENRFTDNKQQTEG